MALEAAEASRVNGRRAAWPSLGAGQITSSDGESDTHSPHQIAQHGEHDPEAGVIVSSPGAAQPATELGHRLVSIRAQMAANRARTEELQQRTTQLLTRAQAAQRRSMEARRERRSSPAGQDLLQQSEQARLLARLESMPVIEQAKGIIMAQSHCGEAQAFDLLRRASQRSNVRVRELAAQIVAKAGQFSPQARQASAGIGRFDESSW
jgi:hypothetical protein